MEDRPIPRPQEIYRHFKDKGMLYQIITIARHTETDEYMVIYQALYGDYKVYARPLGMFMSRVDKEKYPDVEAVYRFEKLEKLENDKLNAKTKQDVNNEKLKETESRPVYSEDETSDTQNRPEEDSDGQGVSSDLLAFLDAETYEQQRNLLIHMQPRITHRLIDDIAAAMDVTVEEGDLDKRYLSLLNCIKTREKYEILDRR